MQKIIAGRSLGRSVIAEVETLRLLAKQRRKASLGLFLKRNVLPEARVPLSREELPAGEGVASPLSQPRRTRLG